MSPLLSAIIILLFSIAMLNIVSLYDHYLCRVFAYSGLARRSLQLDPNTTVFLWAPARPSNNPSLLLLHGFGPTPTWQWSYQVKSLPTNFNLYVPELVFFGASTTSSPERSEVFQAVMMAKMMEELKVERYHVMGTSYGGFVAYNMARMFGERVEKVVIASSGVNKKWKDNVELLGRGKVEKIEDLMLPKSGEHMRRLMELAMAHPPTYLPDFFLNLFVKTLYLDNLKEKRELLYGLTFGNDDQAHVSPLQQEVLVVWGEHDRLFPLELARELKELLGDKARLEVIKNTSHMPQLEDPNTFNDIVLKFFSRDL